MKEVALLFLLAIGITRAQTAYSYTSFDVPKSVSTHAFGINNAGEILGSYTDSEGSRHCFVRSADGSRYTTIDPPAGALAGTFGCSGMNNLSQVVGSFSDAKGMRFYIRHPAGDFTVFDTPSSLYPGANATAINDRGEVVGTPAAPPYGGSGFLRHADGSFDVLESSIGSLLPTAINNKGEIAGWVLKGSSQGTQHGFLRSADGVYSKYDLPGTLNYTRIYALNNVGQFAGAWQSGPGFVRNADNTVLVLDWAHPAFGINDYGVIVGSVYDGQAIHGFIGIPGLSSPEPRIHFPGVEKALALGGECSGVTRGTWIEIYGENLAPSARSWRASDFRDGNAPTSLDGVSVSIGGVPAYVSYIGPQQVNALVPSTVATGYAPLTLTNGSRTTAPSMVYIGELQPSLFRVPIDYLVGYAVAVYPDFQTYVLPAQYTNVPTRPAKAGDVIILFGAGFGPVFPETPDGRIASRPANLTAPVSVVFVDAKGPVPAEVLYAGIAPGSVGLYQFNVVVPELTLSDGQTTGYAFLNMRISDISVLSDCAFPRSLLIPVAK